tara:strand:+ start:1146 stop:1556 length:411 start_codon:yes stop_codon:yes gene_type:complete
MATTISNDVTRIFPKMETLTAAKTLTAADSGRTYLISGTGYTVTLPAPHAGFNVKFIVAAAFSTDTVIQTPADNRDTLNGGVIVNGAIVESDATDRVTFEDDAESVGDFIEISSDGTSFFLFGNGNAASSITVGEL